ncbi:hypothetical protein [Mycoplasma seminis]|uniref:DUF3784 domain-containing protein n=1 Tax=Mycoplasma seminis TaxID=512749 RepID=A0ABY9HBS3_9MOLU|nr:hypothetical protein [Mycoplasma seminis]WLP85896.1 hypothetical protein Q8852_01995 [Mycoplasma seminis]
MIPDVVIWILGALSLIIFFAIVLSQAKFINHVKMIYLHVNTNEKMLDKVILNSNMKKFWDYKFWLFSIIVGLQSVVSITFIVLGIIYIPQVFRVLNETQQDDLTHKITLTGIDAVLILMNGFFTFILLFTIYKYIFLWNKVMNKWNINENAEQVSYYEYLKNKVTTKEFPAKVKLNKLAFKSRQSTLTYRTSNLEKLASSKHSLWYKEGKILFQTFSDYNQIYIFGNDDKTININDTDFVAKIITLTSGIDKEFANKKR